MVPLTSFVALIRAVNVGGTGKLSMDALKSLCLDAGFGSVRTYLASGNVVFTSHLGEIHVRDALERRLQGHAGRPVAAFIRTAEQMAAIHEANPFQHDPANSTVAIFLNDRPPGDLLERMRGRTKEKLALGHREIYVAYGDRMADSKLRFPGMEPGTARNMNTIAKLASIAREAGPRESG